VYRVLLLLCYLLFFFNDPAPTDIYTLSLHDALPISIRKVRTSPRLPASTGSWAHASALRSSNASPTGSPTRCWARYSSRIATFTDRKSTRLNSSHLGISYAVFCLKKKKKTKNHIITD